MSLANSEFWDKARRARDKLADQFLDHPEVSLIDIGYEVNAQGQKISDHLVLRIHVRLPSTGEMLNLPAEIDSIPIQVVVADYRLE